MSSLIDTNVSKYDYLSMFEFLTVGGLFYYIEHYNCHSELLELYDRRSVLDLNDDYVVIETPELEVLGIKGYNVLLDIRDDRLFMEGNAIVTTKFVDHLVNFNKKDFEILNDYLSKRFILDEFCCITNAVVNSFDETSTSFNYLLYDKLAYRDLDFSGKDVNVLFTKYGNRAYNANVYIIQDMLTGSLTQLENTIFNPYLYNYLFGDLNIRLNEESLSVFQYSDGVSISTLKGVLDLELDSKLNFYINFRAFGSSMLMMNNWESLFRVLGSDYYNDKIEIKLIFDDGLTESDAYVKCVRNNFIKHFKNVSLYTHHMSY